MKTNLVNLIDSIGPTFSVMFKVWHATYQTKQKNILILAVTNMVSEIPNFQLIQILAVLKL